jgi:hypothetical protein
MEGVLVPFFSLSSMLHADAAFLLGHDSSKVSYRAASATVVLGPWGQDSLFTVGNSKVARMLTFESLR